MAKTATTPTYSRMVKIPTVEELQAERAAKEEAERQRIVGICRMAIKQPASRYEKFVHGWMKDGKLARLGITVAVDTDTGRVLSVDR